MLDPQPRSCTLSLLDEDSQDLYDAAPCGYASTLADGTLVRVNRTLSAWTGFDVNDLLGTRVQSLMTVAGQVYYECVCAPLLLMQGTASELAFDLVRKDGTTIPTFMNFVVKRAPSGEPALFRVTVFNATDRRSYERELLLAQQKAERHARMQAMLLSMLSHDLRTPLTSFSMAASLLETEGTSPENAALIDALKASADNLVALVDDILDFSRMDSGELKLLNRPVEFRALIERTVAPFRVKLRNKHVSLVTAVAPEVPDWLLVDASKLGQVLSNLLGNAIKFTRVGFVELRVTVVRSAENSVTLNVSVSDTGIGIAPDRLEAVFDEYTQASPEIHAKYGGAGLGLAICRRLLELYGSRIVVTSVPGEGSRFSFPLTLEVCAPHENPSG